MTYADLPEITSKTLPDGSVILSRRPSLYCRQCSKGPFSADRGDYWLHDSTAEIVCQDCGEPVTIVIERTVIVPWAAREDLSRFVAAAWVQERIS